METYEQKRRRLFGKQHLPLYLAELRRLTNIDDPKKNILSIEETDKILNIKFSNFLKFSHKFFFDEKIKLKTEIEKYVANDQKHYLFTSYSEDCGACLINKLSDFNFNFEFDDELFGLVTLVSGDLSMEFLLDFYEENNDKFIELEISLK